MLLSVEGAMKRATDNVVRPARRALNAIASTLREDMQGDIRDQSAAAIESIRIAVAASSNAALTEMRTSFSELGSWPKRLPKTVQSTAKSDTG